MARKVIGSQWDRENRNAINENFMELYRFKHTADEAKTKSEEAFKTANQAKQIADSTKNSLDNIIKEQSEGGNIVPEVVDARGGETTLGNRLDNITTQLEQTVYNGIGATTIFNSQMIGSLSKEIEKYKKQRILQGQATITAPPSNGYFRDSDPFVTVAIDGFPQINAPNYDVLLTPVAGDVGLIGELIAYDKTQNGFKVKMTGSAKSVTFLWTLFNPNV